MPDLGDPFNSVIRLDENSKRPDNPMVNAGAIATAGLIKGLDPTEKLNRMLDMFRRYIGRDVYVNAPVFMSERVICSPITDTRACGKCKPLRIRN